MIYCIVPRDLGRRVAASIARFYAHDSSVQVLVDRRQIADRRSSATRRAARRFTRSSSDTRRITNEAGRRIADRRRAFASAHEGMPLPRSAQRHRNRIAFAGDVTLLDRAVEDVATARCITRIQSGDEGAVEDLYRFWFGRVFNYYRVLGMTPERLEHALQRTFRRVFDSISVYDFGASSFREWLAWHIVDEHPPRRLDREGAEGATLLLARMVGDAADPAIANLRDEDLVLLIRQLPSPHREVAALRYLFGLVTGEVAEVLDIPVSETRVIHEEALGFIRGWAIAARRRRGSRQRLAATMKVTHLGAVRRS